MVTFFINLYISNINLGAELNGQINDFDDAQYWGINHLKYKFWICINRKYPVE